MLTLDGLGDGDRQIPHGDDGAVDGRPNMPFGKGDAELGADDVVEEILQGRVAPLQAFLLGALELDVGADGTVS
jgi:hypothetical protein